MSNIPHHGQLEFNPDNPNALGRMPQWDRQTVKFNSDNITKTHIENSGNQNVHLHLHYTEASPIKASSVPDERDSDAERLEDVSSHQSPNTALLNCRRPRTMDGTFFRTLNACGNPTKSAVLKSALKSFLGLLQDDLDSSAGDEDEPSVSENITGEDEADNARLYLEATSKIVDTLISDEQGLSSDKCGPIQDWIQKILSIYEAVPNEQNNPTNFPLGEQHLLEALLCPSATAVPSAHHGAISTEPNSQTPSSTGRGFSSETPQYIPHQLFFPPPPQFPEQIPSTSNYQLLEYVQGAPKYNDLYFSSASAAHSPTTMTAMCPGCRRSQRVARSFSGVKSREVVCVNGYDANSEMD